MPDFKNDNQKKINNLMANYKDVEGVSTKQLNFGLWFIKNKKFFFLGVVCFLSLCAISLYSYSAYKYFDYLFNGLFNDQTDLKNLTDTQINYPRINYNQRLTYSFYKTLPVGSNRVDLIGQIKNENPMMWATFNYYFLVGNTKLESQTGFILPANDNNSQVEAEIKYLVLTNQEVDLSSGQPQLIVEKITWNRLDAHTIKNWLKYKTDHLNFIIANQAFTNSRDSGLSEKDNINLINFDITNNTAYNYRDITLMIVLSSQGDLAGIYQYTIDSFLSQTTKKIQINWLGDIKDSEGNFMYIDKDGIEVIPDINIFNAVIYQSVVDSIGDQK